jgi:hypothetical protein
MFCAGSRLRALLVLGALIVCGAPVAIAQDSTNTDSPTNFSTFQLIMRRNIFDPTRRGGRTYSAPTVRSAPPVYFSFAGVAWDQMGKQHYAAMFNGYGAPDRALHAGDVINGFRIAAIPPADPNGSVASVQLTISNQPPITLYEGQAMKRVEDGPWKLSEQPAPDFAASVDADRQGSRSDSGSNSSSSSGSASSSSNSSSTPAASAGESDILKRLRQQREAEDK